MQKEHCELTGWRQHAITADRLQKMKFPQINYIVPGLISEGLTLLAGRPKVGKSWMALDICNGVAGTQSVLGNLEPLHGDVLYAAMEDAPRRLQNRMHKIAQSDWPKRLTLVTSWSKLDEGGIDDIADWAKSSAEPRLVVLDTLAGVKPKRDGKDAIYDADYKALTQAHRLANDGGFGILILTHTRKADSDDPLDAISGTLGQVGCADTGLVLARGPQGPRFMSAAAMLKKLKSRSASTSSHVDGLFSVTPPMFADPTPVARFLK